MLIIDDLSVRIAGKLLLEGGAESLIDVVLRADLERSASLART
jgi:hypothetical protein